MKSESLNAKIKSKRVTALTNSKSLFLEEDEEEEELDDELEDEQSEKSLSNLESSRVSFKTFANAFSCLATDSIIFVIA
jgi:hypothetical protein